MKVIELTGEIGWEIWAEDVRQKLHDANGESITVRWSTLGGNVFEGSDIMSLFIDYKRDHPEALMYLEIKAVAASMGSAIAALDLWESIGVDRTTAYMIHNPSTFAYGDYREMDSMSKFLKDMRDVYVGIYKDRTNKSESEISDLVNAETWFFGQAIIDNGFADKIITKDDAGGEPVIDGDSEKDETIIIIDMKKKFSEMKKRQKELSESMQNKIDTAAFYKLPEVIMKKLTKDSTVKSSSNNNPVSMAGKSNKELSEMTPEELKKENPETYAAIMKAGAEKEREANTERVKKLTEMKAKPEYQKFPDALKVIDEAIEGTMSYEEVQPLVMAAIVGTINDPAKMAALESPGSLHDGDNNNDGDNKGQSYEDEEV